MQDRTDNGTSNEYIDDDMKPIFVIGAEHTKLKRKVYLSPSKPLSTFLMGAAGEQDSS